MVSVLVGVAVAAGGHLLWLRPQGSESPVAMPDRFADDPFNGSIQRGEPDPASTSPSDEPASATPTQPSTDPAPEDQAPADTPTAEDPTSTSATSSTASDGSGSSSAPGSTSAQDRPRQTTEAPAPPPSPRSDSQTSGASPSSTARVVSLVNSERADAGCSALSVDNRLTNSAQRHSDDMAQREYLSHTSPDGTTFDERISEAGYPDPAAENIAMGLSSPEAVMDAWMSSDGHRRNILNCDINTIGVGVNSDGWYWTQNFGY
ncbi:CAP domain-containing protein [Prauserella cavernicola]|uniref:CAP domain-containing protein n=1 Tax=Prauserella cavernicola TaxID=2800127 RepID=A0A934QSS0_9PSEU|nr:CAP domain-containing protein [Prauserella cavernicola]MBK1784718.1 CAP domain-containing protein [Prauserella cavernicola]